jgi:hypothetical protein
MTPRQQLGAGIGAGCSVLLVIGVLASCMVLALGRPSAPLAIGGGHNGAVSSTATPQTQATNAIETPTVATPTPTCITGAVNCNPWGYNFTNGSRIFNPAGEFCSFFKCIANFWSDKGYVVECRDGTYSKEGGEKHACMRHHGVSHTLLQP